MRRNLMIAGDLLSRVPSLSRMTIYRTRRATRHSTGDSLARAREDERRPRFTLEHTRPLN